MKTIMKNRFYMTLILQDFFKRHFATILEKSRTITDILFKDYSDPDDTKLMFHRVGLRAGTMIFDGEFKNSPYLFDKLSFAGQAVIL